MYLSQSKSTVIAKVADYLEQNGGAAISEMAKELALSEGEVTFALPAEKLTSIAGEHAQNILELLPTWGKVTTIVHSFGSIFEFKAPFPKGKEARGYYNLIGKEGELHGHLRLDLVKHIAVVSKPFMKMESHYIGFFDEQGNCVFKVYLGRDKKRQLFPEQIEKLQRLKQDFALNE